MMCPIQAEKGLDLKCTLIITIYNFWTVYCAMQQLSLLDYKYLFQQSKVSGIC